MDKKLTYEERIKWFIDNFYETGMEYQILLESYKNDNLDEFEWYDDIIKIPKYLSEVLDKKVYEFKTKNKEGFTNNEINILVKHFPNINMDKFNDALSGITCILIDGESVIYHDDIYKALRCGLENRGLYTWEWD